MKPHGSKVFDPIPHVFRFVNLPDQPQPLDEFAECSKPLRAVSDSGMRDSDRVELQIVVVLAKDDAVFLQAVCELLRVGGPRKPNLESRRHVDAKAAEAPGQGFWAV